MEGLLSAHLIIAITCFFGKKTNPKKNIMVLLVFEFPEEGYTFFKVMGFLS